MPLYLDSSIALKTLFAEPGTSRVVAWVREQHDAGQTFVSSRLLRTELHRVLRRDGRDVEEADPLLRHLYLMRVDNELLDEAGAIEPHVRTLDAIHLASARRAAARGPVTVVTHDETMRKVAEHLGMETTDPAR